MSSSKTRSDKDYTEEETDRRYAKALKGAFTTRAPPLTPKAKKPVNPKMRKLEPKRTAKAHRAFGKIVPPKKATREKEG